VSGATRGENTASTIGPTQARARFQYSLRSLLIAVALLSLLFASAGPVLRRTLQRNAASAAIEALGGRVDWDNAGLLGHVCAVSFSRSPDLSDDDIVAVIPHLQVLHDMGELQGLGLGCTPVGDASLEIIADLIGLRDLRLMRTGISDAGLAHCDRLLDLARLDLRDTTITDRGLLYLAKHTRLEYLWLQGTCTTEEGREALQRALPNALIDF
jgi:hypothetical protein